MDHAAAIHSVLPATIELRHRLHQIPELGYEERQTAATIRGELDRIGLKYVHAFESAPTATVAWIGDTKLPCVALRADIDALPILEETGLPYASKHRGVMHACGHDGHTSILVGVAKILKAIERDLRVCVKLIWQPAEEGGGGAKRLCDAGVLNGKIGPKVDMIYGLHGWPGLPLGVISTKPGALLAATDSFEVTFTGRGGHGAFPHLTRDPIVTAAEAVMNLQQFVSRETDPTDSAVITIGQFSAGTATNVIPDRAVIGGTARTLTDASRENIQRSIRRRCEAIAAANECACEMNWIVGYPPTVNHEQPTQRVADTARRILGADQFFSAAAAVMGGEDFAYYLEEVPGCFFFLGVNPDVSKPYPQLHTSRYDFTDDAMEIGIKMFLHLVTSHANQ